MKHERGAILIVIMWLVVFLSMLAMGLAYGQRVETRITRNCLDRTVAHFTARAGVEKVIAALHANSNAKTHHTGLGWWSGEKEYKNIKLGQGVFTVMQKLPAESKDKPVYGITDEESKLNVNNADEKTLARIKGISATLAKAIVARRKELLSEGKSGDSLVTTISESKVKKEAKEQPLLNTPFRKLDDLLKVQGLTKEILFGQGKKKGPSQFLTCFSSGKLNVNTAPAEVIMALGVKKPAYAAIKQRREGGKGFKNIDEFLKMSGLLKQAGLNPIEKKKRIKKLKKTLAVTSSNFRLVCVGIAGRSPKVAVHARLTVGKKKILVTSWKVQELKRG